MSSKAEGDAALRDLAQAMGILPRWRDIAGTEQLTGPDTQRALLAAMGVPSASEAEARESLRPSGRAGRRRIPGDRLRGEEGRFLWECRGWHLGRIGRTQEGRDERSSLTAPPVFTAEIGDESSRGSARRNEPGCRVAGAAKAWGLSACL